MENPKKLEFVPPSKAVHADFAIIEGTAPAADRLLHDNNRRIPMTGARHKSPEPLDIRKKDVADFETDSDLKSKDSEIYPDESISLRARRQAARQHEDAFIVATDLEDDDQRDAAPGTREQP